MANRPVFEVREGAPYFRTCQADFVWNSGLAKNQKQKNIRAIHEAYLRAN